MQGGRSRLRDQAQREPAAGNHRGRLVDQCPDGGDAAGADDVPAGDQRAEPVGEVDDLLTGDPGKEVLVAAGESDHFMREDRPDDQAHVVVDDRAVEHHLDGLGEAAVGQFARPVPRR